MPGREDWLLVQVAEAVCAAVVAVVAVAHPEAAVGGDAVLSCLDSDPDAVVEGFQAWLAVSGWVGMVESVAAGFFPGSGDLFAAESVVLRAVLHLAVVLADPVSCPPGPAFRPAGLVARGVAQCQASDKLRQANTVGPRFRGLIFRH